MGGCVQPKQEKTVFCHEVLEQAAQGGSWIFSKGFWDLTGQSLDKSVLNSELNLL